MTSFEELAHKQKTVGERIETTIRNFKKDSATRKESPVYFQERLKRLDDDWSEFEANDNAIRLLENMPLQHEYFTQNYYHAMLEIVQRYRTLFEGELQKRRAKGHNEPNVPEPTDKIQSEAKDIIKLVRRQAAIMSSLERLLEEDLTEDDIIVAKETWQKIEAIHYQIAEICDDPIQQGYDMEQFIQLEKRLRKTIKAATLRSAPQSEHRSSQPEVPTIPGPIPIPKITLNKFDGNYLQWQEFQDLFSSLIVTQPIPNVQKMWYLKTHLAGEAAKLIKHFSATGENFEAAWELVVDRYANKRLLVSKLIQELVDAPNKPSTDHYKSLHDKIQECLLALNNLDIDTSSWDPLLLHLLVKRLDQATRLRYEQSLVKPREVPTIKVFLEFLERNFQSMETMADKEKLSMPKAKICTSITAEGRKRDTCIMCKQSSHPLYICKSFLQLSSSARLQFIQKYGHCVNCLKPGHGAKTCILKSCMKCNKKHNTLLHLEVSSKSSSGMSQNQIAGQHSSGNTATSKANETATTLAASKQALSKNYVLLSTALIKVTANGQDLQCRAVLDSGSQINLVSERLVKRLGITPKPASICISGIGASNTKVEHRVNVALHSRVNNFTTRLEAAVLPHIIAPQPSQAINIDKWPIPQNIELADPNFHRPDKIDVLLGAEFYHQLLSVGQIHLADELPTLQNTVFGWVIAGKIGGYESSTSDATSCGMCTEEEDINLNKVISQLWELETIHPAERSLSGSERQCEDHFTQTHKTDKSGRFMVKIPFCNNPNVLGESHGIAYNRFLSLERRLAKVPEIKTQYVNFMKEYEKLGHMTEINVNSLLTPNYFIPHHCILRPESLTTKLRVVFDASTKTSSGLSLNDIMYTGPTVQSELFSILLRFRLPRFVFTTDIEKMYRQMLVHPDDRQFQIIIWREDPTKSLKYYQLNTITYGTRSAPYLATKCLETIAKDNKIRHPYGAQFLLENFYVDDGIGGSDSLMTALTIQTELRQILNQHGLKLQKWTANHQKLIQNVKEEQQEVNFDFNNDTVKTLGLTWLPKADQFCIKVCLQEIKLVTKRTVSSDLARLFDPLGLLSPIVVSAKMFIQELWQMKMDWDEELPVHLHTKWMSFRTELEYLNNLKLSRHIFEGNISSNVQIHAFADASEKAYGAVVYVRSVIKNNQIIVRLLCAKSRIAPLKRQTLPRLELCAALLSAQLTARVKKDLKLERAPTYFWTDSEIVLAWINSQSSSYQTFVANRVAAIQELSLDIQWRHVKSKDNPADILSRGLSPKKFVTNTLWFYGPVFLHGQQEIWPQEYSKLHAIDTNNVDMERKKITAVTTTSSTLTGIIYNIQHGGSFRTLQRVVAYMLRFINQARNGNKNCTLALSVQELEKAIIIIIREIQQVDFEEDLKHLKKYNSVRNNSALNNLTPFLDNNGIIRVGGRLDSSNLPYDARHPMLLPYNDPVAKLLMQMVHEQNKHCGPQALLAYVRQKYWPVKGKSSTRAIVQHCVKCSRAKPQLFNQIMGNLPSSRITPARPFINSGVDFCGPFWVHYKIRGKKPQKAYIAVFCCFATKAVHLELVSDLTTEAFIGALKRFISRRGHCKNLYCDNATNFVGAKNQLANLSETIHSSTAQEKINSECTNRGIVFNFIPPRAPHFGGLWEAAVKSAKHLLVRSVATASLTYEELDTVVIEIEGILNSRPISPMSDNPNDLAALTPAHFLIGEPLNAQVDVNSTQPKISLLTRWKLVTHLKKEFWRRWSLEYLCELQYRNKWKSQKDNIRPGDMVIIKEDNITPLKWSLGRVTKVHHGDDGFVRVADVKTSAGIVRRPISRLAPLPVCKMEANESSIPTDSDATTLETEQSEHLACNITTSKMSIQNKCKASTAQNEKSEIPKKKRRISSNPSIITVMLTLFFIPLVLGAQVHIEKFSNNLGIHFEGIGSATISSTDWQLLIYYDLTEFWSELSIFSQGTKTLNHLCGEIEDNMSCVNLVSYFEHTESELTLDSTLLSGRIRKRAALDLVGNIAHSLFGVLDSEYAKDMSRTIAQVKENEDHLLNLLKNQTSIIDSTINIMKSDQEGIKKKFDQIDSQLTQVRNSVLDVQHQEKIYRLFLSLCIQLTITAANLQRTQSSILDVLTNTHHGIISPLLLTPHQLQQEVKKIKFHMPESLELPVKQEDALQLYKIMTVKGGLTENTVIFSITLPLVEREQFEIFYLIPVPVWMNHSLVSIKPCSPLLIINSNRNQYFTINENELRSCSVMSENKYLCTKGQMSYEQGSTTCNCEIQLFHNKTQPDCPVQQIKDATNWIPLHHKNQWIYAVPHSSPATVVCKKEITQVTLEESGLLIMEPECTLKYKFTTVKGQQTMSSSLKSSYTSFWKLTKQNHETRLKPLLNEIQTSKYISQIQNLSALQSSLAAQEVLQLPNKIETHNYHHMTIGYTALFLTIGTLIYLVVKRKCQQQTIPIPAPRNQQTTSEFTVHI